ncbi:MAG TPA: hypothetical protein VFV58_22420 [Blastocatellia bacterium]|jgi:hypothetical protein|nr:hypothetical protein [Blastocatellia bacterium]
MWTLALFLIAFLLTLFLSLYARYSNGAGISELTQSRFYELIPVRALVWLLIGVAVECSLLFLYLLGLQALTLYDKALLFTSSSVSLLPYLLLACVSTVFGWLLWGRVIALAYRVAPKVDLRQAKLSPQIRPQHLVSLGAERFPNHIDPEGEANIVIRRVIIGASILVIGLLSCAVYAGWIAIDEETMSWGAPQNAVEVLSRLQEIAIFFLWTSSVSLALLLFNNRDYTFLPFRQSLICQGILVGLIVVSLFIIYSNNVGLAIGIGACLSFCAARAARDLWLSRQYKLMKQVTDPIAADLKRLTPYLAQVSESPDFRLPELDTAMLSERVTRGCVNVEERGLFVVRSFARFMRIVEIEKQNFAVAMLRYLTVDRGISLSSGDGTYESLRHPQVPIWNLQLFPLCPPAADGDDGFRDMDDSLSLDHEWDVIRTCSTCGGSGTVWETETYYETEYYTESYTDHNGQSSSRQASRQVARTRQVLRTCSGCSGRGRTRHRQILNTLWRHLIPRITAPEIPTPELVENAEEERYFYFPLTAEFESTSFSLETYSVDDPLVNQMIETGRQLVALHPEHTQSVLSLKGGRLYKADFQVCGFRAIHIVFNELGGRDGWFFGKRPEFYFPRLPLCYATIGVILFLPPLALALAILLQKMIFEAFSK